MDHLVMSIFDVHKKFIRQVCGEDYRFTDEEISQAVDFADEEIWKHISQPDVHYFFTEDDWIERNRLALQNLSVSENIDG